MINILSTGIVAGGPKALLQMRNIFKFLKSKAVIANYIVLTLKATDSDLFPQEFSEMLYSLKITYGSNIISNIVVVVTFWNFDVIDPSVQLYHTNNRSQNIISYNVTSKLHNIFGHSMDVPIFYFNKIRSYTPSIVKAKIESNINNLVSLSRHQTQILNFTALDRSFYDLLSANPDTSDNFINKLDTVMEISTSVIHDKHIILGLILSACVMFLLVTLISVVYFVIHKKRCLLNNVTAFESSKMESGEHSIFNVDDNTQCLHEKELGIELHEIIKNCEKKPYHLSDTEDDKSLSIDSWHSFSSNADEFQI